MENFVNDENVECLWKIVHGKNLDYEVAKTSRELKSVFFRGNFHKKSKNLEWTWLIKNITECLGNFAYSSENYFDLISKNVHPDDFVSTSFFINNILTKPYFVRTYRLLSDDNIYSQFTEHVLILGNNDEEVTFIGCLMKLPIDLNTFIKADISERHIRDKFINAKGIFGWRKQDGYIHCNSVLYDLMNFDKNNKRIQFIDFVRAVDPLDRSKCFRAMDNIFRQKKRSFFVSVRLRSRTGAVNHSQDEKRICISGLAIDFSKHFNPMVIVGSIGETASDIVVYEKLLYDEDFNRHVLERNRELENELLLTKKAEEQLVENLKREQELNKIKGLFVNMVSHEMRTPLAIIQGVADLVEAYDGEIDDAERKGFVQSIKKSVLRLTRTMDSVLILEKAQNNQLSFQPFQVDIIQFFKGIINELEGLNEGRKIFLEISKNFPKTIAVDSTLVYHAVSNLLGNALKYSAADRMVSLKLVYEDKSLILYVKDEGIGIPQSEIKDIFRLFKRGSNVGNRKGIGIGTFIIRHCVSLHKGHIEINSKENVGTTVKVTLPILE